MECLKTNSPVLQSIGLALLKYVSSHRGLTYASYTWLYNLTDFA